MRLSNLAIAVVSTSLFASMIACSAETDADGSKTGTATEAHHACVFERSSHMSCASGTTSTTDWTADCSEDSDCSAFTNDSDVFDDCSISYSYRNKRVLAGTCAEATKKTGTTTSNGSSSSSSSPSPSTSSSSTPTLAPTQSSQPAPPPPPAGPQPGDGEAQCSSLVTRLCQRFVACGANTTQYACEDDALEALDCSSSYGVSSSYSSCMSTLSTISCSTLANGLPSVCKGVVLTSR